MGFVSLLLIIFVQRKSKNVSGGLMSYGKIIGYVLYAIGIIGGVEGAIDKNIPASVVAIIIVIIGSYLLDKK